MQRFFPGGIGVDPTLAWMAAPGSLGSSKPGISCMAGTPPWPVTLSSSPWAGMGFGLDLPPPWLAAVPAVTGTPVITAELLRGVMPKLTLARAETFVAPLNGSFARYSINTAKRMAAFLGQVAEESNQLRHLEEGLYYSSANHLKATFPTKFKTVDAAGYTKNPEKLANYVYADRLGNGNTASGEGWKYRGRGLIQLTGKSNYQKFMDATGVDVITKPELLLEPRYAVLSATWFWNQMKLNDWADKDNYKVLTKRVNSASLGFKEREAFRKRALLLLTGAPTKR
jgi:putative chitinase